MMAQEPRVHGSSAGSSTENGPMRRSRAHLESRGNDPARCPLSPAPPSRPLPPPSSNTQYLFVHIRIEVANEEVGPDVVRKLVLARLVDADGLAKQLGHVEDLHGIVGVLLRPKLHKAVALVLASHPVLGHVDVHCDANFDRKSVSLKACVRCHRMRSRTQQLSLERHPPTSPCSSYPRARPGRRAPTAAPR